MGDRWRDWWLRKKQEMRERTYNWFQPSRQERDRVATSVRSEISVPSARSDISRTSARYGTVINDGNIKYLVKFYIENKRGLPIYLQDVPIGDWDVSHVTNMNSLFEYKSTFIEDISRWNVSNVTNMESMFMGCKKFNQDLSNWDVSKVENMKSMFSTCREFNQDLSNWDVSNVKDMSYMFFRCEKLEKNPGWVVNKGTNQEHIFGKMNRDIQMPLHNVVLKESSYDIKGANQNIKNMIMSYNRLSNENTGTTNFASLPEDLLDEIIKFFDPDGYTQIARARKSNRASKPRKSSKTSKLSKTHPGGGGYAGGRRRKTRKRVR